MRKVVSLFILNGRRVGRLASVCEFGTGRQYLYMSIGVSHSVCVGTLVCIYVCVSGYAVLNREIPH